MKELENINNNITAEDFIEIIDNNINEIMIPTVKNIILRKLSPVKASSLINEIKEKMHDESGKYTIFIPTNDEYFMGLYT